MLRALLNPFGIVLLLASLVLVLLALLVIDRLSGQAIWFSLVGLAAYGASTAVVYLQPAVIQQSIEIEEPGTLDGNRETDSDSEPALSFESESDTDSISDLEPDPGGLYKSTQTALRRINKLPNLSRCDLINALPRTLQDSQTPLEKAQALREVLIAAIEKLKAPAEATGAGSGADLALGYNILRESYIEDKFVVYICRRHSISQTKYFREQRDAVLAISRDLEAREELL